MKRSLLIASSIAGVAALIGLACFLGEELITGGADSALPTTAERGNGDLGFGDPLSATPSSRGVSGSSTAPSDITATLGTDGLSDVTNGDGVTLTNLSRQLADNDMSFVTVFRNALP